MNLSCFGFTYMVSEPNSSWVLLSPHSSLQSSVRVPIIFYSLCTYIQLENLGQNDKILATSAISVSASIVSTRYVSSNVDPYWNLLFLYATDIFRVYLVSDMLTRALGVNHNFAGLFFKYSMSIFRDQFWDNLLGIRSRHYFIKVEPFH